MIDNPYEIGRVRRTVGSTDDGEMHVVTIARTYPTTITDLWEACTDPDRIQRWFAPVTGDLRVGGHYQVEGNAGGTVTRCDPPTEFAATWEFDGDVSWIEVRLAPEGAGSTRFELEHRARVGDDRWGEYGPGAVGVGWDLTVLGLGLHLADGDFGRERGLAWMASDEGRAFMAATSDAWCTANIAGGADEAGARAAAERTTAAYTAH